MVNQIVLAIGWIVVNVVGLVVIAYVFVAVREWIIGVIDR